MQTLRKRTSPCKYKNDPSRFLGEGITFKAKLIGILEVSEARGDKMCQDALNDLKIAIRAAGEHKQRITISISIDGLRLRDEKTGDCLYHHPVHKISFIAQDMSDSRAFGYIFGSPDTGHRFFGIKTDKTASQVVISMRDLFQVVFELKKKEIEMAKHHSEQHHLKYESTGYVDSIHFPKDENDLDKDKGKYSQLLKSRCPISKIGEPSTSDYKRPPSEAIADLLDLEHELNNIQQGISQMDKITPSDPFGPLTKGDSYLDPFDDSFSAKTEKPEENVSLDSSFKRQPLPHYSEDTTESDTHSSFFKSTVSASKSNFFSQFSPGLGKPKADDSRWFDQETESLFDETVNVNNVEPTSSPIALSTPALELDQAEGKKSPIKTDLFTELDPLGTGRVKPYVDKKDFFQELKNPPKKVLKEMISDTSNNEVSSIYFPAQFKDDENVASKTSDLSTMNSTQTFNTENSVSKFSRSDPFEDSDPFEKTDPFQEEAFPSSADFPSIFEVKPSTDGIFEGKASSKFDQSSSKDTKEEKPSKSSPTTLFLFSSSSLRVSLPPEKSESSGPLSLSMLTSKLKSSPNSPEMNSKEIKRKCYQSLKQNTVEGSEESPIHEETFVCTKIGTDERRSPFKDKFYSARSPSFGKTEKGSSKMYSSVEILDATTPDPPPRAKTALFSIKPPPLPPKKQSQPVFRPPARPPSVEEATSQYDYLDKQETSDNDSQTKEELKCVKLKKQFCMGKESPLSSDQKKQGSDLGFPLLPPPPHRKISNDNAKNTLTRKSNRASKSISATPSSVLNLKLNQLDNTGLENLAITLGIPSENIYSMTLQELTKMLAGKYLNSTETKGEESHGDTFEADFEANFEKMEINPKITPSYDKYAVFKELIESESKATETMTTFNNNVSVKQKNLDSVEDNKQLSETTLEEEDKYAALRQLSLNTSKSENFSEDEEKTTIAENSAGDQLPNNLFSSATYNSNLESNDSKTVQKQQIQAEENKMTSLETDGDKTKTTQETDQIKTTQQTNTNKIQFTSDSQFFPLMDQFSDQKKLDSPRDSWATFEKPDFEQPKTTDNFNENENSPFSSDGKEEVREIPFHWHQNTFRKRIRKDVPWQDDDESWDDYSPKESFCSDESSHEDRSPDLGRDEHYEKTWKLCEKPLKKERLWNEKSGEWNRRDKWQEETEDEFEESWKKQKDRMSSYDPDRKNTFWRNHEGCSKRYDCCNIRSEPWDENERYPHFYHNRRKRSESDNEYRKRCDSDTSDKECVWTSKKSYADSHERSGKQKLCHNALHNPRDRSKYYHESRTKHRKGVSQKRPSSVSESKRNFDKMYSPNDYPCRGSENTYAGKRDSGKEEYSRHQFWKDYRGRSNMEYPHYYSFYGRKPFIHPSKVGNKSIRGSSSAQDEMFQSPNKRLDMLETGNHEFEYFESFDEKTPKYKKAEFHFPFDSYGESFEKSEKNTPDQTVQSYPKSPDKRGNHWASTNGKTNSESFFTPKNNNENYGSFKEDFATSPKNLKEVKKNENASFPEAAKPPGKNKNHLSLIAKQESSSALRKSDSINIFSRDKDPFEGDDFFSNVS